MNERLIEWTIDEPIGCIDIVNGGPGALDALASYVQSFADDSEVHVLLLSALEGVFSSIDARGADAASVIERLPQPVICCIKGPITGAGLALALACDIRIATRSATFVLTDVADGRLPPLGATQRLQRVIGQSRASAMILLGESLDADAALACGLINEIAEENEMRNRVWEIATRIAAQGPIAVRYAKEAIRQGLDMPLEQALRYETDLTIILQTTDDRAEGVRAFLEKRSPNFRGS